MLVGIANGGLIDWNNLQIIKTIDEEGRLQVISEEQMFDILGLIQEIEHKKKKKLELNIMLLELFLLWMLMVQLYMCVITSKMRGLLCARECSMERL
jgi:hypothetical protein